MIYKLNNGDIQSLNLRILCGFEPLAHVAIYPLKTPPGRFRRVNSVLRYIS